MDPDARCGSSKNSGSAWLNTFSTTQQPWHQPSFEFNICFLAATFSQSAHLILTNVVCLMEHYDLFFLQPYAVAGIRTHVSRVALNQWDLLKDALPTQLLCRGSFEFFNSTWQIAFFPVWAKHLFLSSLFPANGWGFKVEDGGHSHLRPPSGKWDSLLLS